MKTEDYGLVYVDGEFKYFLDYRIIKEKYHTYVEVDLARGGTTQIHSYFDKRRQRQIEAIDAIHRWPKKEKK